MLMIRFQRIGRANDPAFRIVVLEKERAAKSGHILEQVGTYNPRTKTMTLSQDRVTHWTGKGAQLSDSLKNLLINKKVLEGKKTAVVSKATLEKNKPKAEEAVAAPVAEPAPAAEAPAPEAETPEAPAPSSAEATEDREEVTAAA